MTDSLKDKVSKLFLDIERQGGTTHLNEAVLDSLSNAIHDFKERDEEDFLTQFRALLEQVKNTEPRIALVIDHLYHILETLQECRKIAHPHGHIYWEKQILKTIAESRKHNTEEHDKICDYGVKQIMKGDVILIHSRSGTVLDVLRAAKNAGKDFSVVIAEQESDKTCTLIEDLHRARIPFRVVPEYMLSHVEQEITKVFIGAITLNNAFHLVADAGTAAVVSEFNLKKKPVFAFLSTRKFSLWKSRVSHHTYKASTRKTHDYRPIEYERLKFSHDRVDLDLCTYLVTEQGLLENAETKKLYHKRYGERANWRKEFMTEE